MDGDLCEMFVGLTPVRQKAIADDMDRTPHDILKKLEEVRNKML